MDTKRFKYIDAFDPVPLVDSFVKTNKIGTGKGEARLYVGTKDDASLFDFFGNEQFSCKCFLPKKDLMAYLDKVKGEYIHHTFKYRNAGNVSLGKWNQYVTIASALDDMLFFDFERTKTDEKDNRVYGREPRLNNSKNYDYINSPKAFVYDFIRTIAIPTVTYIHFVKYETDEGVMYYARLEYEPELAIKKEYTFKKEIQKQLQNKYQNIYTYYRTRPEQRNFRSKLIKSLDCSCLISGITDDFLLEACHIKPYSKSTKAERIDTNNGLLLSPNIHVVFDLGYITISDDKRLLISPLLKMDTRRKLNIKNGQVIDSLILNAERMVNMRFHRENIFKKIEL